MMISLRRFFYDRSGNGATLKHYAVQLPLVIFLTILSNYFRHKSPWINYSALKIIEKSLSKKMRCLEFGSGYSTYWLSKRCSHLVSIEHDPLWFNRVGKILRAENVKNVELLFCREHDYSRVDHSQTFDFIIVDGINRTECLEQAVTLLKPGGIILCDDTDYIPSDIDLSVVGDQFSFHYVSGYCIGDVKLRRSLFLRHKGA
ncbi:TPA: class I SAM-dependent methyltransferase [Enterobacter asburiae]|nr:class I SAM-dependent methyltransferase [Enterobacter asburiae]